MMKTALIVDSTAYLNEDIANHPDVYTIPLSLVFENGTYYQDTSDRSIQLKFYEDLERSTTLPKSSQPQPGKYYELMDTLVSKDYQAVIAIHLSSGISGTYSLGQSIMQEYQDRLECYCVDSKSSCIVMEVLTRLAIESLESGLSPQTVAKQLIWQSQRGQTYLMVELLDNLVKGGRLNAAGALVGQLLKIRPVLYFDEAGKILLFEKVRTNKKVFLRWIELAQAAWEKYPEGVIFMLTHAENEEACDKMKDMLLQAFPDSEVHINRLGPVITTHTGKGCLGFGILPKIQNEHCQ